MMSIPFFQVDAFTDKAFGGNPAAVCPLESWLHASQMQAIAAENNLAETAFCVPEGDGYRIRWFSPTVEVDLCGHATLATASVILRQLEPTRTKVDFISQSGPLTVTRSGDRLVLDFPVRPASAVPLTPEIAAALGGHPIAAYKGVRDYFIHYATAQEIRALAPDMAKLAAVGHICVTAPGTAKDGDVDFVSRYFAPGDGIPEDPVTGSTHCTLVPLWAERLGKNDLRARQVSTRGGELWLRLKGDRVEIEGQAVLVIQGELFV